MSKFIIVESSYINDAVIDARPYFVSLVKPRPETWANNRVRNKQIKFIACGNGFGGILFDTLGEAVSFANKYSGYVTNLNKGIIVHESYYATAIDIEKSTLVSFNTNAFGYGNYTYSFDGTEYNYYEGPKPSMRPRSYLKLSEFREKLNKINKVDSK